jgi:hypothetical protein
MTAMSYFMPLFVQGESLRAALLAFPRRKSRFTVHGSRFEVHGSRNDPELHDIIPLATTCFIDHGRSVLR